MGADDGVIRAAQASVRSYRALAHVGTPGKESSEDLRRVVQLLVARETELSAFLLGACDRIDALLKDLESEQAQRLKAEYENEKLHAALLDAEEKLRRLGGEKRRVRR